MPEQITENRAKTRGRPRTYTEDQRSACYLLYLVDGLSGREAAERLGIPRQTLVEIAHQVAREREAVTTEERE